MILRGLGLPNCQWRTYDAEEEAAIMALRPDGLLILGYPGSSVLSEKIAQERQLYEALDKPKVLLRPYSPGIITFKPWEWATVCSDMCKRYQDAGIPVECIPANEFNIEAPEGSTEDWAFHVHWLREFAKTFRKFQPDVRLHQPALSPTGNYLQGLWALSEAKLGYDVVDLHCYSTADLNDVLVCSGLFDKPICVTEINRVSPAFYAYYFRDAGDILEGVYWFILRWELPAPGSPNVDLIGSPYFAEFKDLGKGIILPTEMTGRDGLLSASTKEYGEEKMTEYSRARLWLDYMGVLEGTPMFQKVRAGHPELGDALGPERDYGEVRCQFYAGGVVWARIGDWANTAIATSKDQLPLA